MKAFKAFSSPGIAAGRVKITIVVIWKGRIIFFLLLGIYPFRSNTLYFNVFQYSAGIHTEYLKVGSSRSQMFFKRVPQDTMFLKISQISQENICVGVSF